MSQRKYYGYGTYSEDGKLYTKSGKEIKDPEKYYESCRRNYKKTHKSFQSNSYTNSNSYDDWEENYQNKVARERENAIEAYHEYGIEGVEYMSDEELDLLDMGYLSEDDY